MGVQIVNRTYVNMFHAEGGNFTTSYTHSSGLNKDALIIAIAGSGFISPVTYGGQTMTQIVSIGKLKMYYLLNPPTGANNIVVTGQGSEGVITIYIMSLANVEQVGNFTNFDSASAVSPATADMAVTGVGLSSLYLILAESVKDGNSAEVSVNNTDGYWYKQQYAPTTLHVASWFGRKTETASWTSQASSIYTSRNLSVAGVEVVASRKLLRAIIY